MRVGPMEFDYKYDLTPALDDKQTLVFVQGFGDFKITRRLSMDLSLRQTPVASIFPGFNHYISSHATMGIAYKLSKKVVHGPQHPEWDAMTTASRWTIRLTSGVMTSRLRQSPLAINIKGPYELSFSAGLAGT